MVVFFTDMKKRYHILKSEEFQQMIRHEKKLAGPSFVCYHAPRKEEHARVGISLSRKIGNAVERNHIKRQVRMMCHELIDFASYPEDIVLIVRFGYLDNGYADNKKMLEKLLNKATMK